MTKHVIGFMLLILFIILASIESLSLLYWLLLPLGVSEESLALIKPVAQFEAQTFNAFAVFTPFFFVLLVLFGSARTVLRTLGMKGFQVKFKGKIISLEPQPLTSPQQSIKGHAPSIILISSMIAAVLLALYPYSPALNPDRHYIGVDIPDYAGKWLTKMASQPSLFQTINYTFFTAGDRPLSLLAMYTLCETTKFSTWTVAMFLPTILAPATVLATYYFLRKSSSSIVPSLTAVFTLFSYHFTTGVYAGFLSNWMAVIEVYVFSGLLMRAIALKSWRNGFLAVTVAVLVLFTHAETWGMLMGVVACYAALQVVRNLRWKSVLFSSDLKLSGIILVVNGAANALRNYALSLGSKIETIQIAQQSLSIENLVLFQSTIENTFFSFKFRTFLNPFMILLGLIGALTTFSEDRADIYVGSWLLASAVPFMFGNSVVQARILYNLPIVVFAAYGLSFLLNSINKKWMSSRRSRVLCFLLVLLPILASLNYTLGLLFDLSKMSFR